MSRNSELLVRPTKRCIDVISEVTAAGITETEMGQTLLNGANIAMVRDTVILNPDMELMNKLIPGGQGPKA